MNKIIIIGLGNPGKKYENTPHNAGFSALDLFIEKNSLPTFSLVKKLQSEISEAMIGGIKVILVKPLTFMNLSGTAIKKVLSEIKPQSESLIKLKIIVIHDDIDIPIGDIKISENRGAAGHKGVLSIIKELGTKDFTRVRIGILPDKKYITTDIFVLRRLPEKEKNLLKKGVQSAVSEIERLTNKK